MDDLLQRFGCVLAYFELILGKRSLSSRRLVAPLRTGSHWFLDADSNNLRKFAYC
jgi:hypothetical protein